jgi:acyl carrier protein
VASVAHPAADPASIGPETVLLRGGLDLDSLSVLELVVGIEKWGIEVPPSDVTPENLATFGRLLRYVEGRARSAAP